MAGTRIFDETARFSTGSSGISATTSESPGAGLCGMVTMAAPVVFAVVLPVQIIAKHATMANKSTMKMLFFRLIQTWEGHVSDDCFYKCKAKQAFRGSIVIAAAAGAIP